MKNNHVLPKIFIDQWKDGDKYHIKNFALDEIVREDLINQKHLITRIFENHSAFDSAKLSNQFLHISSIMKKILDSNIDFDKDIILSGQEVLFIKYYYFFISILNNSYEFLINDKKYRAKDLEYMSNSNMDKLYILLSINYILFDLFDVLFTEKIFNGLDVYVEQNTDFFGKTQFTQTIKFPKNLEFSQDFRFIDFHFHNIVNNTFLKFIIVDIKKTNGKQLISTAPSFSMLLDERFNICTNKFLVMSPTLCISMIHIGPGLGEVRPIFDLIKNNSLNKKIFPNLMEPDHKIYYNDVYLSDEQEIIYKPYLIVEKGVDYLNNSLFEWLK